MDGYILGIDGGGTGTKAVLLRGKEICHSLETGTINLNGAPEEVVTENIRTLLRQALSLAGQDGSADGKLPGVAGNSYADSVTHGEMVLLHERALDIDITVINVCQLLLILVIKPDAQIIHIIEHTV